nr:MAG TPA: hypothetical protein [Caudoviricetes sp.]
MCFIRLCEGGCLRGRSPFFLFLSRCESGERTLIKVFFIFIKYLCNITNNEYGSIKDFQ